MRLMGVSGTRLVAHDGEVSEPEAAIRRDRTAALVAAARLLAESPPAAVVLEQVPQLACAAVAADAATVALVEGDVLRVVATAGYPADVVDRFTDMPLDAGYPITEAVRHGAPIGSSSRVERRARFPALADSDTPVEASLAVPIRAGGEVLGALGATWSTVRPIDDEVRGALTTLATLLGLDLRTRRLEADAERFDALRRSDAIAVISGEDDRIVEADDAFLRLVGRDRAELADGIDWRTLTPDEHRGADERRVDDVRDGPGAAMAKEYVRPDGSRIPVLIAGAGVSADPFRWCSVVIDLTDQRAVRAVEEPDAAILRWWLDAAPVGFALLDGDLRVRRINPALADLVAPGPVEPLGRRLPELLDHVRPPVGPLLQQVVDTGAPVRGVDLVADGDGQRPGRHWRASGFPLRVDGEAEDALALFVQDTTDLRTLESELAEVTTLLDAALLAAPIGMALVDHRRRVVRVNGALRRMAGLDDEVPDHRVVRLLLGEDAGEDLIGEVLGSGRPVLGRPLTRPRPTGDEVEVVVHGFPVRPPDSPTTGVGIAVVDVTERNRRERSARRSLRAGIERRDDALEELQSGLLPSLPEVDGIALDARYLPAETIARLGGDWFDAVLLDGDRLMVAVGDAVGHGPGAVALMDQARNGLRALLLAGHPLDRSVALVSQMMDDGTHRFASVCVALLSPGDGRVHYVVGGHPPPLLRRVDGRVERLTGPHGPVLGPVPDATYATARCSLGPGDVLVLYTDGLIERRATDIEDDIERLAQHLAELEPDSGSLPDRLIHACLGGRSRVDDVCVLVAHRTAATAD